MTETEQKLEIRRTNTIQNKKMAHMEITKCINKMNLKSNIKKVHFHVQFLKIN